MKGGDGAKGCFVSANFLEAQVDHLPARINLMQLDHAGEHGQRLGINALD